MPLKLCVTRVTGTPQFLYLTCSTSIFSLDRKQENSLDAWPGGAAAYRKSYDARKRLLPSLYQTPSIAGTSFSIQVHDKCDNITTKAI
jgi:hypothetical protein